MSEREPVYLTAVIDEGSGFEAIYVDGEIVAQESTLYAVDIVKAANGKTAIMSHVVVCMPHNMTQFPHRLERCVLWEIKQEDVGDE